ncbi:LysR family transcriptional regulator [Ochrobactrum sp. RH2CCR150]|uniref:LysR family transcriptional regulator n=1 Tax=Ochrobactrum sp. RH2CCR150 TaxID=2587044 RepID=UPI0015F89758|nr:DNA-binding transcriptional LysR family regulator [Ochrobactrum sp. RH2CCR150]
MKGLDIEAARAFVLTAELRSFTRAAEALNTTQAAVSLKIKRLEDGIGRKLLERTPRLVRLSADGDAFLPRARALVAAHEEAIACFDLDPRRLVVGISHHIVGAELPLLLKRLGSAEPGLVLEMRIATSRDTLADFERGLLDAAIVLHHDNIRRDGEKILEETFGWMATPDFEYRKGEPLRLATQAAPCNVRSMATDALDAAHIPWTEAFVGGGVMTVGAAASAGLAVAALGRRVAPAGTIDIGPQAGLPPLPSRDVLLYTSVHDQQAKTALRALSAAIRATANRTISV